MLNVSMGAEPAPDIGFTTDDCRTSKARRVSLHRVVIFVFLADCLLLLGLGLAPIVVSRIRTGAVPSTMAPEVVLVAIVLFLACQHLIGSYKRKRMLAAGQSIRRTVFSLFITFSMLITLGAAAKVTAEYSRLWFFTWMAMSLFAIPAVRWMIIERLRLELAAGAYVYRAASLGIMGTPLSQDEVSERTHGMSRALYTGRLQDAGDLVMLDRLVRDGEYDEVYITVPWHYATDAFEVLDGLRHISANVYVSATTEGHMRPFIGARVRNGRVQLQMLDRPIEGWESLQKRALDLTVAYAGVVLFAPLMVLIALAIKLTSRGPVFFRQPRQGFNGRTFDVLKFRSMRADKADRFADRQTSRTDERVTLVGKFIRRASLDELPQLFNVIRGDMSIVGPRPHALRTTAEGKALNAAVDEYAMRHRVKPGLTGWAQVNGLRGELDSIEKLRRRVQHDLDYIENWSIGFDLHIILKTLLLIVRDRNAY